MFYHEDTIHTGVQNLQSEMYEKVYMDALRDSDFKVDLEVLKMILCGVPRSGKSTFWNRLVNDNFDTEKISESTGVAEHHYIHVSVKSATLFDWHLCHDDDAELEKEALTIYKHILENYNPSKNTSSIPLDDATPSIKSQTFNPSKRAQPLSVIQKELNKSEKLDADIERQIDGIFRELEYSLARDSKLPDIPRVQKMFNLIDTGGQSAFLELLPVITVGKALYLIFFTYGKQIKGRLKDEYQGPTGESTILDNEYDQTEVILQSLRCVATTNSAHSTTTKPTEGVAALLVGTHTDVKVDQKEVIPDNYDTDMYLKSKVKSFLDTTVLEYASIEELILKVNNKCDQDEFKKYQDTLIRVVDKKFSRSARQMPGSWLMFSIILRKLKLAGHPVVSYKHCEQIASGLYIPLETLGGLLLFMHKNLGLLMYFPEVPVLENLIICDPGVVFTSISELILKTFIQDAFNETEDGTRVYQQFKDYAIFEYNKLDDLTKRTRKQMDVEKLVVLLKHVGIIAPVQFSKQQSDQKFECTLNHDCKSDSLHCIQAEYIIPCVLKAASPEELKLLQPKHCAISPLYICFTCEFAPIGGFCYLFTRLISDNQTRWKPYLPELNAVGECPRERVLRRNKVTFLVDSQFFVTFISTPNHFKVCVEQASTCHSGYEFVCYDILTAIKNALSSCLNAQVQQFKFACQCTGHGSSSPRHHGHLMEFQNLQQDSKEVKAECQEIKALVTLDMAEEDQSVAVWCQVCHAVYCKTSFA